MFQISGLSQQLELCGKCKNAKKWLTANGTRAGLQITGNQCSRMSTLGVLDIMETDLKNQKCFSSAKARIALDLKNMFFPGFDPKNSKPILSHFSTSKYRFGEKLGSLG